MRTQTASRNILSMDRLSGSMKTCEWFRYWCMDTDVSQWNCEHKWAICEDDFERKSRALSFPRPQTLITPEHMWWWRSVSSSSLLVLFRGNVPRPLIWQPFYATVGPKRQTVAPYPAEYYVSYWEETKWPPLGVLEVFSFERTFRNCGANINSSARNTSLIPWQYKCKCSYTTLSHILIISLCIYKVQWLIKK